MAWSRRIDWCAVVAVPVVTLTAFLDPIDTFAGFVNYATHRWGTAAPRIWLAGDVAPGWRGPLRPPDRRPRRRRRAPGGRRGTVRP